MKTGTEQLAPLNAEQLREINGGGFAYDVGRVIRFFVVSGGGISIYGIAHATGDWIANDIVNKYINQ